MMPPRIPARVLTQHLITETPLMRTLVRELRGLILKLAPGCAEAMKFHVLCYYHADSYFGSIGGNICMIEIKKGSLYLSFIHGALLKDPAGLLAGKGKFKRFAQVPDRAFLKRKEVAALIRQAAKLRPWDEEREVAE